MIAKPLKNSSVFFFFICSNSINDAKIITSIEQKAVYCCQVWIRTTKFLLTRNSVFQYILCAVVEKDLYFTLFQFCKHCNNVTTLSLLLRKMFVVLFFSKNSEFYSEGETCYFDGISILYSWSRGNFQSENIFPQKTRLVIYFFLFNSTWILIFSRLGENFHLW